MTAPDLTALTKGRVGAPNVLPSYTTRGVISLICSPLIISILKSALFDPITINPPTWLRVLVGLLVLVNYRSTPFAWHLRVLWPAIKARAAARPSIHPALPFIRSNKYPTTSLSRPILRLDKIPIGKDIFEDYTSYPFTATFDDCDWNGHLSNSCYSKNLDVGRISHNSLRFLKMHFDGAWVALGGSAFTFHKEIPMLSKYEIRMSVEAWDDKWIYVVGRFVSVPKQKGNSTIKALTKYAKEIVAQPKQHKDTLASSTTSTGTSTPISAPPTASGSLVPNHAQPIEGETLYCTSVSRYCFKAGRRTIPPWLVVASSGYGTWASTRTSWDKAESLRAEFLQKTKSAHRAKTGRELPKDGFVAGGGYRKAGLLSQYRLEKERKGTDDEKWMRKEAWETNEWETRRIDGLKRLQAVVGGVLPPADKK